MSDFEWMAVNKYTVSKVFLGFLFFSFMRWNIFTA